MDTYNPCPAPTTSRQESPRVPETEEIHLSPNYLVDSAFEKKYSELYYSRGWILLN